MNIIKNILYLTIVFLIIKNVNAQIDATVFNFEGSDVEDMGEIYLIIDGGAPPYDIVWDNGSISGELHELLPGEYCVTITDALCCPVGSECFNIYDCPTDAIYDEPMTVTLSCDVQDTCPVSGVATIVITGGSGNYDTNNLILCNDNSGNYCYEFKNGLHTFEIQDGCTGEYVKRCFSASNGSSHVNYLPSGCLTLDNWGDQSSDIARLQVYPSVYNDQTIIEIELDEETPVKLRSVDIYGSNPTTILEEVVLSAGTHQIPVNTSNDPQGKTVFILESDECIKIFQAGLKIGQ